MAIAKESELYDPLKKFFEASGCVVRSEVNKCDLVAKTEDGQFIIVELKKSLNMALLVQAVKRQSLTKHVFIAVEYTPRSKKRHAFTWKEAALVCKKLEIGLITVEFFKTRQPRIEVLCEPTFAPPRRKQTKSQSRLRKEFLGRSGDYQLGGIHGQKLVTAYREKSLHCAYILKDKKPLPLKIIREQTGNEQASSILQKNYYGWFARESRGIYRLTEQGEAALKQYEPVIKQMLGQHNL